MDHKLTDEQMDVLNEWSEPDNLQIVAYAGCGKSSTLQALDKAMPEGPRVYLAFNKKIVTDMEKSKKVRLSTECKTLNSLGSGVWAKTLTERPIINKEKTLQIFKEVIKNKSKSDTNALWDSYNEIRTAYDLAKARGYIPNGAPKEDRRLIDGKFFDYLDDRLDPLSRWAVDGMLRLSITRAYKGDMDFNDQLYMPTLFGGSWPKYPVTLADEFQDFSPINHRMMELMVGKDRRLIAVGDPFQSIYQFRGAAQDGMAKAKETFNARTLPLSISFRCPRAIVENARWRAPGFSWFKAGGSVEILQSLDLSTIADGAAVICRNNAPLFRLALNLLSVGRSVSMAGTDVGPKLLGILRRFGDMALSRFAVYDCIENWHSKRAESKSAGDIADCLRVFAALGSTLGDAIAHAEALFRQTGTIYLTTGHKAKGLEWDVVYHLDPGLLSPTEQDLNLRYVIQTRSRDRYYEIDSAAIA